MDPLSSGQQSFDQLQKTNAGSNAVFQNYSNLPDHIQKMIIKFSGFSVNALALASKELNEKARPFLQTIAIERNIVHEMLAISEGFQRWRRSAKSVQTAAAIGKIALHEPQRTEKFMQAQDKEYADKLKRAIAAAKFAADFAENKGLLPELWKVQNPHEFWPTFKLVAKYDLEGALKELDRFIATLSDKLGRDELKEGAAGIVSLINPDRALEIAETIENVYLRIDAYSTIIKNTRHLKLPAFTSSLERVEKLLEENLSDEKMLFYRIATASDIFEFDSNKAYNLLDRVEESITGVADDDFRGVLWGYLAEVVADYDPERALQALQSVKDNDSRMESLCKALPKIAEKRRRWDIALNEAFRLGGLDRAKALFSLNKTDLSYAKDWREVLMEGLRNQIFSCLEVTGVHAQENSGIGETALLLIEAKRAKRKEFVRLFSTCNEAITALALDSLLASFGENPRLGTMLLIENLSRLANQDVERAKGLLELIENVPEKVQGMMVIYRAIADDHPDEAAALLREATAMAMSIEEIGKRFDVLHTVLTHLDNQ